MANVYKTARGKTIDMDKVKLSNERVAAVGNMKVNARGDTLGAGGQIIAGRNQVMDRVYNVEGRKGYSPNDPAVFAQQQALVEASKAKDLHDLATTLIQDTTEPTDPVAQPATRGTLASSVAKTVSVAQEPLPNPKDVKKSNGPSRI